MPSVFVLDDDAARELIRELVAAHEAQDGSAASFEKVERGSALDQ
jgi:hypothetical protein